MQRLKNKIALDFSTATLEARRQQSNVFKILKKKMIAILEFSPQPNCQLRLSAELQFFRHKSTQKFLSIYSFFRKLLEQVFPQNKSVHQEEALELERGGPQKENF